MSLATFYYFFSSAVVSRTPYIPESSVKKPLLTCDSCALLNGKCRDILIYNWTDCIRWNAEFIPTTEVIKKQDCTLIKNITNAYN